MNEPAEFRVGVANAMKSKIRPCLALVLSGGLFGCSAPAGTHAKTVNVIWEYKTVQRLDYPGLNNNAYSSLYAFPWKTQLNYCEQQGWSVDSVSFSGEGLASGHPIQVATIVLKRAKK
jgi:hypothetical protein